MIFFCLRRRGVKEFGALRLRKSKNPIILRNKNKTSTEVKTIKNQRRKTVGNRLRHEAPP
jgi:hypothetical protein